MFKMFTILLVLTQITMIFSSSDVNPTVLKRLTRAIQDGRCEFGMCSDFESYPREVVKKIVDSNKRFSDNFGNLVLPHQELKVMSRFNFDEKENVCEVRRLTMYPQVATNVNKDIRLIVNIPGHYQAVTFDYCVHSDSTCPNGMDMPFGYHAKCEQQYIKFRMVSVDVDNGELFMEYFPIPSGCACMKSTDR